MFVNLIVPFDWEEEEWEGGRVQKWGLDYDVFDLRKEYIPIYSQTVANSSLLFSIFPNIFLTFLCK